MTTGPALVAAAVILGAYALGCVVAGWYLVRWRTGLDLRTIGSGSSGARNVARIGGARLALAAAAVDLVKGAAATYLGVVLAPQVVPLAMVAVVAGHVWPVQLGFRGGRGIAPSLGATLVGDPVTAAISVLGFAALAAIGRRPSLAGLVAVGAAPAIAWSLGRPTPLVAAIAACVAIVLIAHRGRYRAMLAERPGSLP